MKSLHAAVFMSMASFGSLAVAQDNPAAPAPAAPPAATPTPAPAPPAAAPATPAPVSDAEVQQYATALSQVQAVQKDTTMAEADKQQAMIAKVQASGLAPQRFNEITQAYQNDPALQQRIQTALTAVMNGPAGSQ